MPTIARLDGSGTEVMGVGGTVVSEIVTFAESPAFRVITNVLVMEYAPVCVKVAFPLEPAAYVPALVIGLIALTFSEIPPGEFTSPAGIPPLPGSANALKATLSPVEAFCELPPTV